jgi:hypothetical protein
LKQRIKVIDGEQVKQLFSLKPSQPLKPEEPVRFGTKEELTQSLVGRGYSVKEKAKIKGRSGVEYTFDILAYIDIDHIGHSLGIDFLVGENEVGLDQVALFDTKAYDAGIDNKVIVVVDSLAYGTYAVKVFHDENKGKDRGNNVIICFEVDGVKLCHLGDLGHKLSEKEVAQIGKVDVLFVPLPRWNKL